MNFGAFVEVLPGKDALVHISELSEERVPSVEDVVSVGDEVTVMVTEKDGMGRLNASRKALLSTGSNNEGSDSSRNQNTDGDRPKWNRRPGPSSSGPRGNFPGRNRR